MICKHTRMGDNVRLDLAISLETIDTILRFMELDYIKAVGKGQNSMIATFAMFNITC